MPEDTTRAASRQDETVSLDRETVPLDTSAPAPSQGPTPTPSQGPTPTPAPVPFAAEVSQDPWGRPTGAPYVLADPTVVPSFDASGAPEPEAPASARRTGVLVAVAVLLVAAVVAGAVVVSGVFDGDSSTAASGGPSAGASPSASPSSSTSGAAPAASATAPPSIVPSPPVTSGRAPAPVPAGPRPVAAWGVKAGRGDAAAGGRDLTATNVTAVGWSGGFNGKDSEMTAGGPVVSTGAGRSFTIAASVFLVGTGSFQTAVSQDGAVNSAFYLQYSGTDKKWAFSRVAADAQNAAGVRALSNGPAATLKWVDLVGVYDADAGQLRLYVDGAPQGTAAYRSPFASTGEFALGRGRFNGGDADWFRGNIGDVKIYDRALTGAEVAAIPPQR